MNIDQSDITNLSEKENVIYVTDYEWKDPEGVSSEAKEEGRRKKKEYKYGIKHVWTYKQRRLYYR